jgi:hypothetical protein
MRGNPLDLDYLIRKIAAVDWNPSRRAMQKGWMDVWRREWEFLWTGLNHHLEENPDDKIALNLVRKLCCKGMWHGEDGTLFVHYVNKLYLTKSERPWLIAWIEEQMLPVCTKCGKHTNKIFSPFTGWGDSEKRDLCRACYEQGMAMDEVFRSLRTEEEMEAYRNAHSRETGDDGEGGMLETWRDGSTTRLRVTNDEK